MKKLKHLFGVVTFITLALTPLSSLAENAPSTFAQAKRIMAAIYSDHPQTAYCGCTIRFNNGGIGPGGIINETSCGFDRPKAKLHWEHIVPASKLGQGLSCWKLGDEKCVTPTSEGQKGKAYKGRKCCRKVSQKFRAMEADLYNLVPSIDKLNMARSNYIFVEQLHSITQFGTCDFSINKENRTASPPENQKGLIARTYLRMQQRWQIDIPKTQQALFKKWSESFPETDWEVLRRNRIHTRYNAPRNQVATKP